MNRHSIRVFDTTIVKIHFSEKWFLILQRCSYLLWCTLFPSKRIATLFLHQPANTVVVLEIIYSDAKPNLFQHQSLIYHSTITLGTSFANHNMLNPCWPWSCPSSYLVLTKSFPDWICPAQPTLMADYNRNTAKPVETISTDPKCQRIALVRDIISWELPIFVSFFCLNIVGRVKQYTVLGSSSYWTFSAEHVELLSTKIHYIWGPK